MNELKKGKAPEIIRENIEHLQSEGFTENEAIQMAYAKAGKKVPFNVYRTHQFERADRIQKARNQE